MKIGILGEGYACSRIITSCNLGEYVSIRWHNLFWWLRLPQIILLHLHLIPWSTRLLHKLNYEYKSVCSLDCDILHFYTTINFSKDQSWVLSIEHCVPYVEDVTNCLDSAKGDFSRLKNNPQIEKALAACAQPNCKRILAISDCTRQIQLAVAYNYPNYYDIITQKLIVAHPPQPLLLNSIDEKPVKYDTNELFTFVFIGNHFYRKGGREIVHVLSQLHKRYKFQLYMIGDASKESFKAPMLTDNDITSSLAIIENNKDWIHYSKYLPNNEVLNIIKHSHVALLPTWSDSYGFSVLECQACGTPVITTSIRSLPEINNNEVGWMINVPTNTVNHPIISTLEERITFQKYLEEGLYRCCEMALSNPEKIKIKSEACLQRITKQHNPEDYNRLMKKIYMS